MLVCPSLIVLVQRYDFSTTLVKTAKMIMMVKLAAVPMLKRNIQSQSPLVFSSLRTSSSLKQPCSGRSVLQADVPWMTFMEATRVAKFE